MCGLARALQQIVYFKAAAISQVWWVLRKPVGMGRHRLSAGGVTCLREPLCAIPPGSWGGKVGLYAGGVFPMLWVCWLWQFPNIAWAQLYLKQYLTTLIWEMDKEKLKWNRHLSWIILVYFLKISLCCLEQNGIQYLRLVCLVCRARSRPLCQVGGRERSGG